MSRYASVVAEALSSVASEGLTINVEIKQLGASSGWLNFLPSGLRFRLFHLLILFRSLQLKSNHGWDILHLLDGSYGYAVPTASSIPFVVTAHDLIPLKQSMGTFENQAVGFFARWIIGRALKGLAGAKRIIAVSINTRSDLIELAKLPADKIDVVNLAVTIPEQGAESSVDSIIDSERFILHVGNNAFYKNREGVLSIFSKINNKTDARLVMAGAAPSPGLVTMMNQLELSSKVKFVVDPDDQELFQLYRRASLFLFPSVYEGFGWPPLEAMASGCPVVCSSNGSLQEVTGGAALTTSAVDEEEMARLCLSALENEPVRKDLINKGLEHAKTFTLQRMGNELLAVYKNVLGLG